MEDYCCFYANKSGIVKEAARDLTNKASRIPQHLSNSWENCLNNWNWMSWVLPFLGPLFLLTLILTFGPCLMHLLSKFLWHRSQDFINQTIHELLLIRSNYQKLRSHKNLMAHIPAFSYLTPTTPLTCRKQLQNSYGRLTFGPYPKSKRLQR